MTNSAADEIGSRNFPITRHSTPRVILSLIRNPLQALPPTIFSEPVVFTKISSQVRLYLADPVLIHEALVKNADALGKGEDVRRALGPALGQGLLTADGDHWKWQRQSVAGAFRQDRLSALLPGMIATAERTRERWLSRGPGVYDIGHEMMRTTFDIIVETMMSGGHGIDVARVESSISDYLKPSGWTFALSVLGMPEWIPYPGRMRARASAAFLRSSLATVIETRRRNPIAGNDMVNMLLAALDPDSGRMMSDEEIIDNLLTFITAGHETTALGLAWTFYLLARHPELGEKARAEIEAVTGGGPLGAGHIAQLTYTKQVFSEAMRLYPPAPIITRTAMRDFQLGDYTIPQGTVLYVPIYAVHRHASLWTDPLTFDPERFTPDAVKARHRYAYMPFGAGPRVCIGNAFALMEAVTVLAVLLRSFTLTNRDTAPPTPVMKVTLRPKPNLMMTVVARTEGQPTVSNG